MTAGKENRPSRMHPRDYIYDAIELKRSIVLNRRDKDAVDGGRRIRYVFDADVACTFLFPNSGTKSVDLFHKLSGTKKSRGVNPFDGLPELSAAVCAEYLFGGQLPGQEPHPPYICLEHALEVEHFADNKLHNFERIWATGKEWVRTRGSLVSKQLREKLAPHDDNPAELVRVLTADLSKDLRVLLLEKAIIVQQFHRLFGECRLSPAPEAGPPDTILIADLFKIISRHDDANELKDETPEFERRDNDYRDAAAVAQVLRLNQNAPADEKCLLVTGSPRLHAGIGKWNMDHEPNIDFLRHPRQYLALLNTHDMRRTRQQQGKSVLDSLERAVDDLLKELLKSDPSESKGYDIKQIADEIIREYPLDKPLEAQLAEIRRYWQELSRSAVLYCRIQLEKMYEPVFKVINAAANPAFDEEVLKALGKSFDGLANKHIVVSAAAAITKLKGIINPEGQEPGKVPRSPAWFRYTFKGLLPQSDRGDVNDFFRRLINERSQDDFDRLVAWINSGKQALGEIHFLLAAAFLKFNQWETALYYFDRAHNIIAREIGRNASLNQDLFHEVKYGLAVCKRLSEYEEAGREAKKLLDVCVSYHSGAAKTDPAQAMHVFRKARAISELAILQMTRAELHCMNEVFSEAATCLSIARQLMSSAQDSCEAHYSNHGDDRNAPRFRELEAQLSYGGAASLIIEEFLLGQSGVIKDRERDFAQKMCERLRELYQDGDDFREYNLRILEWQLAFDVPDQVAKAQRALELGTGLAAGKTTFMKIDKYEWDKVRPKLVEFLATVLSGKR
jgi:hypothetical protein